MGLRLDGGRRPVKFRLDKISVTDLWPVLRLGETENLARDIDVYINTHRDEAEEAYKSAWPIKG